MASLADDIACSRVTIALRQTLDWPSLELNDAERGLLEHLLEGGARVATLLALAAAPRPADRSAARASFEDDLRLARRDQGVRPSPGRSAR